MPSGRESHMYAGNVKLIVHPPITTKGQDADQVSDGRPTKTTSSRCGNDKRAARLDRPNTPLDGTKSNGFQAITTEDADV